MSRYQKGKTNLDFTEARDSEWQWHQLGCMQVCTSLQTDNHAPTLSFLQTGRPSCHPTNSVKALKAQVLKQVKYCIKHTVPKCQNDSSCSVLLGHTIQYFNVHSMVILRCWSTAIQLSAKFYYDILYFGKGLNTTSTGMGGDGKKLVFGQVGMDHKVY